MASSGRVRERSTNHWLADLLSNPGVYKAGLAFACAILIALLWPTEPPSTPVSEKVTTVIQKTTGTDLSGKLKDGSTFIDSSKESTSVTTVKE